MNRLGALLTIFISFITLEAAHSQTTTYQQRLYYTCKLWGFVKYYHSEVSTCQINWDSVLVSHLPSIKITADRDSFNTILDSILIAAGPMLIDTVPFPDTLPPELKRNRDWTWWLNDTILRGDIKTQLDTIKNNFRPHSMCQVDYNYICCNNPSYGALAFQYDFPMISMNTSTNYPDEWNRLLMFFTHWNIIKYFNPYNYVSDISWDTTLFNYVIPIANVLNSNDLFKTQKKILASLNDAHVEDFSYKPGSPFPGYYSPKIKLKYVQGKYIVTKSGITNVNLGDEVISVNGLTTQQWEDSLAPYTSYGDSSILRRFVCQNMLSGHLNSSGILMAKDSLGNSYFKTFLRNTNTFANWFFVYPNDTLKNIKWKKWDCNVGYVNMGELLSSDVNAMYTDLQSTDAIIFELRTYPNGTFGAVAGLIYPSFTTAAKVMLPDVTYPGTYYWANASIPASTNPYNGRVIILLDEVTQSQAEYSAMFLEAMPNAVKVGSHTAGTDGNLTYLKPSTDIYSAFTSYGIFYPNGDSTQRIGIVPDSLVYPTQTGIRQGRDEVLEKALQIAGCWLGQEEPDPVSAHLLNIYPNPASGEITITLSGSVFLETDLQIHDISGREIKRYSDKKHSGKSTTKLDLSGISTGLYFIRVATSAGVKVARVVVRGHGN